MIDPNQPANVPERGTIRCGPFELGYAIEGQGRPALVIGSSVYYPRTFSADLRQHLRLAFVDHRGFANPVGDHGPADYQLDVVLADMELMRQQLGFGTIVVIGHSGHGYLALEYAKRYPQHVSHVVMIATGPSQSVAHQQLTEERWREAVCPERKARFDLDMAGLAADLAASPDERFITFCLRMGARSWYDPTFDARPLWEGVRVTMPIFDHLWGEAFRDIEIRQGLDNLDIPVFLALGRFDYLVAPGSAWEPYRGAFRDLTVRVFDRSSHTPQLEESRLFDGELLGWLSAARPRPGMD
jgi:proline iminopeptidase